jgi:hypothetical protein
VLVILTAQAVYAFNARCIAVCARPTGGFASRTVVARSTLGAARRSHRAIARRDLDEGAVLTLHDLVPANRIADVVTVGVHYVARRGASGRASWRASACVATTRADGKRVLYAVTRFVAVVNLRAKAASLPRDVAVRVVGWKIGAPSAIRIHCATHFAVGYVACTNPDAGIIAWVCRFALCHTRTVLDRTEVRW